MFAFVAGLGSFGCAVYARRMARSRLLSHYPKLRGSTMTESTKKGSSRRQFLGTTGRIAAATTLAGFSLPHVHAGEDNTLQVALIGCGGRGTGAVANAMNAKQGPLKLVAMNDVFGHRLQASLNNLKNQFGDRIDVPEDRQFVEFDGYRKATECLKPGDIVISATPPAFRWAHFEDAVKKGLHIFMEKPLTADGPTSRRMLATAEQANEKNLKVGVGLMSRHSRAMQELHQRIQDGEIGDIISMRGYRMHGPIGSVFSERWPGTPSELLWQIQRFHSFLWASGGGFSDFNIHIIDHLCWMKNAWPVKAQAVGGRHFRGDYVDQNFDSYSVEYVFEDGSRMHMDGRCMSGGHQIYSSYVHGSKGSAIASNRGDCGLPSRTFSGQNPDSEHQLWASEVPQDQRNPYDNEWNALVDAIRDDLPFNEAESGVYASLVTSMGRKAAHTAREITLEAMLADEHEYAPGLDQWTMESPPPLESDDQGRYPIPIPGLLGDREF